MERPSGRALLLRDQPRGRIAVRSWYGCISQPGRTGT